MHRDPFFCMDPKLNILLVEDVRADAELVERELKLAKLSFGIRRVETRAIFLSELAASSPDIILADYSLPQFGALEVLELLQEQQSDVPVILVTGSNSEEIAVHCMQEGAEDYILKSSLKRLPAALRKTLKKRQADRERREAESALRRSEEKYRLITDNTRDLICLLDLEGHFLYASPSFERMLGQPVKDLIGTKCAALIYPDDIRALNEALDEALFFREGRNVEVRFSHLNGGRLTFESAASYIFDETGKPQRALLVSRDTSDRKRAEKEIRKLAACRPGNGPVPEKESSAVHPAAEHGDRRQVVSLHRPEQTAPRH